MDWLLKAIHFQLLIVFTQQQKDFLVIKSPTIDVQLTESGFHRNLIYNIQFEDPLAGTECEYVLRQHLPAAVYVNIDQLNDMQRLKKLNATYPSFVDIEKPTELSNDFEIFLKGVTKFNDTLILPIHFRYHAPNDKSSFVTVDISEPTMFINCPRYGKYFHEIDLQLKLNADYCLDVAVPNMLESTTHESKDIWNEMCNWKYIELNFNSKSPLQADIPVGNKNAYTPILYATIIISWGMSLFIVLCTKHVPTEINQRLEEQRIFKKKNN